MPSREERKGPVVAKVKAELEAIIPFHLEGLREGGAVASVPGAVVEWVEV